MASYFLFVKDTPTVVKPWFLYVFLLRSVLSQLNSVCIFVSLCSILLRIVTLPASITGCYKLRYGSCHWLSLLSVWTQSAAY